MARISQSLAEWLTPVRDSTQFKQQAEILTLPHPGRLAIGPRLESEIAYWLPELSRSEAPQSDEDGVGSHPPRHAEPGTALL